MWLITLYGAYDSRILKQSEYGLDEIEHFHSYKVGLKWLGQNDISTLIRSDPNSLDKITFSSLYGWI